jgi:hypothetical protein
LLEPVVLIVVQCGVGDNPAVQLKFELLAAVRACGPAMKTLPEASAAQIDQRLVAPT